MILKNFVKKIKIWHLLCGITFWTIWIECKDKVFSQEQWYESKVNYLIMYAKVAWEWVVNYVTISTFLVKAFLQGFDQTWETRNVLCRHDNMKITWIGNALR